MGILEDLSYIETAKSPFEIFKIAPRFDLNLEEVESRYFEFSMKLHPDRFASKGAEELKKSERLSASLNDAFEKLRKPSLRLESLLNLSGFSPSKSEQKSSSQIPSDLTEEFFELQEMVMENHPEKLKKLQEFQRAIEHKEKNSEQEMFDLAAKTNWEVFSNNENLEKIIKMREQNNYLFSMLENIKKMEKSL